MFDYISTHFLETFDHPDAPCIGDVRGLFTYGQFQSALIETIKTLEKDIERATQHQKKVVIISDNSFEYLVLIYACYFTRTTWVPLNTQLPAKVTAEILSSLSPDAIFYSKKYSTCLTEYAGSNRTYEIGREFDPDTSLRPRREQLLDILRNSSDDVAQIAYIIFTSGSSGAPKGVAIGYESLENYLSNSRSDLGISKSTRNLSITPYYFDAPLGTIFLTLIFGGQLYIYPGLTHPRLIADLLIEKKITYMGTSPGLLRQLLDPISSVAEQCCLEVVGVGGDDLIKADVVKLLTILPKVKILNRYGPTETTSVASSYLVERSTVNSLSKIPIGRPLQNVHFELLSPEGTFIDGAGQGELLIAGRQNMLYYWKDLGLTETSTFTSPDGTRYYRTGDIVTRTADRLYFYVSRCGRMSKRRGYRIYLTEIETAVNAIPNVAACVCIEDPDNSQKIICTVQTRDEKADRIKMNGSLRQSLPEYMLPDEFYEIDTLPLTSTGKIDLAKITSGIRDGQFKRIT